MYFSFICYNNNRKSSSRDNRKQLSVQQSSQSTDGPQSILKAKSTLKAPLIFGYNLTYLMEIFLLQKLMILIIYIIFLVFSIEP